MLKTRARRYHKQRTVTAIRRHGDKIARNTLRLFDKLVQAADEPTATKEDIKTAVSFGIEIFPYIMPKLSAIAPAELNAAGEVIAPNRISQLIRIAKIAQGLEVPPEGVDIEAEVKELPAPAREDADNPQPAKRPRGRPKGTTKKAMEARRNTLKGLV